MSDIQDYIEYVIQKYEAFKAISPIHVYINRINNRLVFQIKDGYKLELQMPETMKLFGSAKKLIDKNKIGEKVQRLEVVEVVLEQCNLEDNFKEQNGRPIEIEDKVNLTLLINK